MWFDVASETGEKVVKERWLFREVLKNLKVHRKKAS